jgi:hypothetical protein
MSRMLLAAVGVCLLASPVVTAEAPQAAPKDKEAKVVLEPHFRIDLADNQAVDLDTWRTAKGGEQTSEALDVGWDNDGGGAFMRNPKGPARILPLPSADGFKEALAQAVKQLDKLKESASRGALASEARRFAVLTDQGRLAVVEVTEATPAKGRICWSLFQVKPREGGPPEVTPLRHLPPAKGREEPSVLDLASGHALPFSDEAARDPGVFTRMGKGDLLYEDDLYCLRGAKAQSLEGDAFPRVKAEADTTLYKLPKVPCRLRITTAEKKQFDVTILAVTQDKGIDLEYRPAGPPVAPQPQGAGSPATGAGAL